MLMCPLTHSDVPLMHSKRPTHALPDPCSHRRCACSCSLHVPHVSPLPLVSYPTPLASPTPPLSPLPPHPSRLSHPQVALSLMWPVRGAALLNGSGVGEWAHMSDRSISHGTTPMSHIESTRGRKRLAYMQAALLTLVLQDAHRGPPRGGSGRCADRVTYIELAGNHSSDLAVAPTTPVVFTDEPRWRQA